MWLFEKNSIISAMVLPTVNLVMRKQRTKIQIIVHVVNLYAFFFLPILRIRQRSLFPFSPMGTVIFNSNNSELKRTQNDQSLQSHFTLHTYCWLVVTHRLFVFLQVCAWVGVEGVAVVGEQGVQMALLGLSQSVVSDASRSPGCTEQHCPDGFAVTVLIIWRTSGLS